MTCTFKSGFDRRVYACNPSLCKSHFLAALSLFFPEWNTIRRWMRTSVLVKVAIWYILIQKMYTSIPGLLKAAHVCVPCVLCHYHCRSLFVWESLSEQLSCTWSQMWRPGVQTVLISLTVMKETVPFTSSARARDAAFKWFFQWRGSTVQDSVWLTL